MLGIGLGLVSGRPTDEGLLLLLQAVGSWYDARFT
jgi:hypothetical protein